MTESHLRYVSGSVQNNVLVATITVHHLRDAAATFAVRDELLALIDASHVRHVVLDARHVQFIGSIGLLTFLSVRRRIVDGRVVLCNLSEPIQKLFAICRLITTDPAKVAPFEIATTLENALARFENSTV